MGGYGSDLKERILSKLSTSPPNGREHWTGNTLSDELAVPADVIWRCLRKEKIKHDEIAPEMFQEDKLPDEVKYNIPLVLSVREDALPDISDFDFSTKEGFLRDFHEVEKSMLLARGQIVEDITKKYLDEASKKNEIKK